MTFNRRAALVLCSAAVLGVFAAAMGNASTVNKTTFLKFSGPVALPGVALGAGEYIFELANPDSGRNVVKVTNRDRSKLYALKLTRTTHRPVSANAPATVTLGEARPGSPTPIKAWFPINESTGYEFIY